MKNIPLHHYKNREVAGINRFEQVRIRNTGLCLMLTIAIIVIGCESPMQPHDSVSEVDAFMTEKFEGASSVNGFTEVCHVIDFDDYEHGDVISTIELPTPFSFNLTVSVESNEFGKDVARAFDVNKEGLDFDEDLRVPDAGGICEECEGLGRMMVIEDIDGFDNSGDARDGGEITFSGFSGNGTFLVKEFKLVDVHKPEEPMTFYVDGNLDATSQVPPFEDEGRVETVTTGETTFTETMTFKLNGSAAIDEIKLCMQVPFIPGDEGCTPGYWRNHSEYAPGNQADSWGPTGWEADDLVTDAFSEASRYDAGDLTLHEALAGGGGPGVEGGARILLRAAVAALLNASHPDVDYARSVDSVISDVNDALESYNRNTMLALARALDSDNNLGCSL